MNYTITEIYNAVQFGGLFFTQEQIENLALAIDAAGDDPDSIAEVGRLFIAMAKSEIERERALWPYKSEPQYALTAKGNDHASSLVDALRCGGVL